MSKTASKAASKGQAPQFHLPVELLCAERNSSHQEGMRAHLFLQAELVTMLFK
jgi:hypothetical protein